MFSNMIIHIFFKNKLNNLNFEDLLIPNISCLNCYVCNSFISAGCQNPSKSGSYFYQQCPIGLDSYCVQKTTTDKNGNMFYMERVCARDCSSSTNPVYSNKLDGLSETTTGIYFITNFFNYLFKLLLLLFKNKKIYVVQKMHVIVQSVIKYQID